MFEPKVVLSPKLCVVGRWGGGGHDVEKVEHVLIMHEQMEELKMCPLGEHLKHMTPLDKRKNPRIKATHRPRVAPSPPKKNNTTSIFDVLLHHQVFYNNSLLS